ncbi:MAG: hypothetical protein MJ136_05845 [Clostridia bacterium]|nr:hypothetical protein [Clostridia bacterium]
MKKLTGITVVTNGFEVCRQLMNQTQDLYFIGGFVDKRDEACRGKYALQQLKMMHFDVGFFACSGLGEDGVLSGYTDSGSLIVQTALESCDKRVFLCDSSKLFLRRIHAICSLTDVDEVICMEPLPEKLRRMVGINRPEKTEEVR